MPGGKKNVQSKAQQSRDMRQNRLALFIQHFEKEAQERVNELESKLDNMLSTVDRVFEVELMKMPASLLNTGIGDLISDGEVSASDVSIAMKNESLEMEQPLKRNLSKRVKSTPADSATVQRAPSKKAGNRTRTLVDSSSSKNLRGSTVPSTKTQGRMTRSNAQTSVPKAKLRSVHSAGELHCSMASAAAHITVTTAQGRTVSFSEETKEEINLDLLDDVAWCHIQKLKSLMEYLSRQSRGQR